MPKIEALVCTGPGRLQLVQQTLPHCAPGEALVRPRRIGICGTDYHIFQGKHPFLQYPRVMGHELAVEVLETPPGSDLRVGDVCVVNPYIACGTCIACDAGRPNCCVKISVLGVHRDGGMTGMLSIPLGNLLPSRGLSLDACASTEFLAIGAHAVKRGVVTNADNVLVVGAGPIGLGAVLFARLAGGKVSVYDKDVERAAAAQSISGATAIKSVTDPISEMADLTDGNGFDVVFDATGNRLSMESGFNFVAHGGRYVLISVVNDSITFADPDFHRKEMTLLGSRNATNQDFLQVIEAIRCGQIEIDRLVTHRTSLTEAASRIPVWATQKFGLIKALIEIGD
ncbi:zinc-binding alcohol dehydrogenase family protein [Dongia sp.]|uniref:zinc-binding alcohol dehydrogenase family protein n=1 Tax=Dongia sp. TaxID=1977262 RepID=UPI0035B38CBC